MLQKLRKANLKRSVDWTGHRPNITDLEFCGLELGGECGEAMDAMKKYSRYLRGMVGGTNPEESLIAIMEELADIIICTDRVASILNIDLEVAVQHKFDMTSRKVGFKSMDEYLSEEVV